MNKLKRSKTSVGDLEHLDADLQSGGAEYVAAPPDAPLRARPKRGFSMSKLTATVKNKKTPRKSIEKALISRPIPYPRNPVVPPASCTDLGEVSPPPSIFVVSSTSSSPGGSLRGTATPRPHHTHSVSDPAKSWLPPPTRAPPPIPIAKAEEPHCSGHETPLTGILESPFELEQAISTLGALDILEKLGKMEPARLQPPVAGTKARALQQAKEMEDLVAERAKRSGEEPPPYDFYELIGKGSYGRVFKGLNRKTGGLVAIKIIDIDRVDYEEMTSKNLSETLKEIDILQQLRDSKARPYVNIIEEARSVHNELWIVSEYASGGSVATLMKPCMIREPFGLEEKFIIPIARELALGLKYTHEAGVIHRDLKCNNILILEDGRVQLCDFGVSGTLEPAVNKRSTIVGTPNWMAPELQQEWVKDANPQSRMEPQKILYASEVDIWAYGCTIYEMASGFPPFHRVLPFDLPNSGVPVLEGDRHSQELKDFLAFVFQTDPRDRPNADEILEHPFLSNSVKMYPTVMLVKLVEDYYKWEHEGGARASLFNPYGAQAPDPLAPEDEEEDDDWTFSTSDEFGNRLSRAFPDPFTAPGQPFMGINPPPDDEDRFAKLQASIKEEAINRAGSRLNRLFDQSLTPYRYSMLDSGGNGRPPSDLILRDFNPGAPNRETVIDLDFAAPIIVDVPSIDLGEVPTLKANRVQKLIREMQIEDEERDSFDEDDQYTKRATREWTFPTSNDQANRKTQDWTFPMANENQNRATRDWKFPSSNENQNRATRDWKFPSMVEEPSNRKTQDFKFPPTAPKQNRATREWTFSAAMAEANNQNQRNSRRETKDWTFPAATAAPPLEDNRKTRDFVFPMRSPVEEEDEEGSSSDQGPNVASSPTLGPGFRPSLRHATTEPPGGAFDDYPTIISSAPASPQRMSMIDLDIAMMDDVRPSTSDSGSTATYTAGMEQLNENPFSLEDQVHLSQNNNRASYHMKSQSEPNHPITGLLTPQQYDEQGHPTNQDPHHPSMHARGVSSVSQMQVQVKPPPHNAYHRANQRSQQLIWDGWSHSAAYAVGSDESPPLSVSTDASVDSDIDEAWDNLEKLALSRTRYALRPRRTDSRDEDPRSSDTDDAYTTDATYDDYPRPLRVSVGPNGKPLVDFPIPKGPGVEAMLGVDTDPLLLQNALWKSSVELRDGLRASRDLLKAMKLEDVRPPLEGFPEEGGAGGDGDLQGTVRAAR